MEIALRNRILVGIFATVVIVGSGVATALVASSDEPTVGVAVDTTAPGDTLGTTVPSTPGSTIVTTPGDADDTKGDDDPAADDTTDVARYSDPEVCGGDEVVNHGQYVSSQPKGGDARGIAAESDCGKPLTSIRDDGDDGDNGDDGDAPDVEAPDTDDAPSSGSEHGNSANAPGHNK